MAEETPSVETAHLTDAEVENYRVRALSADAVLTMSAHIAGCTPCRERLRTVLGLEETMPRLIAAIQSSPETDTEDDHLDDETLIAFSDKNFEKKLSPIEQEMVACHLEVCPSCRFQANELRALHVLMASAPSVSYAPMPPSLWQRLSGWLQRSASTASRHAPRGQRWLPPTLGLAVGAVAASLVFYFAVFQPQKAEFVRMNRLAASHQENIQEQEIKRIQAQAEQAADKKITRISKEKDNEINRIKTEGKRQIASFKAQTQSYISPAENRDYMQRVLEQYQSEQKRVLPALQETTAGNTTPTPASLTLVAPLGELVLLTNGRMQFTWKPVKDATGYEITVTRTRDQKKLVSRRTRETRLDLPLPTEPGDVYEWQVVAYRGAAEAGVSDTRKFAVFALDQALQKARGKKTGTP